VREASTPTREFGVAVKPKDRIVPALIARMYRQADAIVAVSRGVQHDLLRLTGLPESRIPCIYNPVITERLLRLRDEPLSAPVVRGGRAACRAGSRAADPAKDYPTLLRAFAKCASAAPARLLILGEGELHADLWRLVQALGLTDAVAMPGYEPNPFAYMRRARVFVLSSRYEGLPNALIQAMACGCPVVSTDCPSGPREILDGGRYGALVPVGDVDALADAIVRGLEGQLPTAPDEWLQQFEEGHIVGQYLRVLEG
jgi:glycosyltransferase involved in cell wall biosynthesis